MAFWQEIAESANRLQQRRFAFRCLMVVQAHHRNFLVMSLCLPKAWPFYQGGQLVLQGHCSTAMKRRGWERNSFCTIHIYTVPHVPVLLRPIAVESNTDGGFFLPLLPSVAVGNLLHLMEDWFAIRDWNSCCAWRNFRKGRFTFSTAGCHSHSSWCVGRADPRADLPGSNHRNTSQTRASSNTVLWSSEATEWKGC